MDCVTFAHPVKRQSGTRIDSNLRHIRLQVEVVDVRAALELRSNDLLLIQHRIVEGQRRLRNSIAGDQEQDERCARSYHECNCLEIQ
jgi:hypothetical protein